MGEGFGPIGRLRSPALARVSVRGVEHSAGWELAGPDEPRSVGRGEK